MNEIKIIDEAVKVLENGGVIGYPTDTTYGIGCAISDLEAVDEVFELKGRDFGKPLSVAFSSIEMAKNYVELSQGYEKILRKYLPGPFTFLLKKNDRISDRITAGLPKVGVRIPDYNLILNIIEELGEPIVTTSANLSGEPDVIKSDDLKIKVDFIVRGECPIKTPSTLIDLDAKKILREGAAVDIARKIISEV
jgi:tRNA threonylcarbamoyl adenosine modification protein (Sua5/YciO/YrdC/YwlC family)